MDQKYNTSFIPKKFLSEDVQSGSTSKYIKRRNIVGPGYFIAVLIFIAAIGLAVVLFTYTRIVNGSIEDKMTDLQSKLDELKSEDLAEFLELERQIRNAKIILGNHIAASEVLHKLEEKTLKDVWYLAMDFRGDSANSTLNITGAARPLTDIALQIREFEEDKQLVSPTLTNLERDSEAGTLMFDVGMGLLPELISYDVAVREGRHGKSPIPTQPPSRPSTIVLPPTPAATSTPL